ncbi:hypothetical protein IFR05_010884 [Cadophora sp. M221]|nr:hypothetical protein IFR05_010884 [Cadophora sp. M221]
MQVENWPGSRPEWHDSIIEGFPPSKEDRLGVVLQKLMVCIDRALAELEIHTREVWTNGKTEEKTPDAATPIPPPPQLCTCPQQRPGTFTVPETPCPFCAALEFDSISRGSFTDQLNRNREARNRAEKGNTKDNDGASSSKSPPAINHPWSQFSTPKRPRTAYNSTKPTGLNTSRFAPTGMTTPVASRFNFGSIGSFQSKSGNRRTVPSPLQLGGSKSGGIEDLPSLKWALPTWVKPRTSGPSFSPGAMSVASSNDDFVSPTPDDVLMAENPVYWRMGIHAECSEAWAVVQGLQEGLRAHNIDVTKYEWRGSPVTCLDSKEVDHMKPQPGTGKSILETQLQALYHQIATLQSQVWAKNIADLGEWDASPYNPHKQNNRNGLGTGRSDKSFSAPTAADLDKTKENERRNKRKSIYIGAATS